ncbi:hypothetical protein [Anaeromonas gelatinilytica]|nr:hypothetical protein [Anaeromonas gelatinilytica]
MFKLERGHVVKIVGTEKQRDNLLAKGFKEVKEEKKVKEKAAK